MKKMEKVNNDLFKTLTEEETQLVAGGADLTGEGTWSQSGGFDAKVTIRIRF